MWILSFGALLSMLLSVSQRWNRPFVMLVVLLGIMSAAFFGMERNGLETHSFFSGAFHWNAFSYLSGFFLLKVSGAIAVLFYGSYLRTRFFTGEVISLYLFTLLGMMVLLSSQDVVTILVGLELMGMGLYALVGYVDVNRLSLEGAVKYLILGALATAVFLFGVALVYVSTGSLQLTAWAAVVNPSVWMQIGMLMMFLGLAFKLALVPFHSWAPDVYESAPSGITAFMATCVKLTVLGLIFLLCETFSAGASQWMVLFAWVSALSMVIGNWMALVQSGLKRMLAYSSIAHSGYMAMVLCTAPTAESLETLFFYLTAYTLASLVVFGCLMWLEEKNCRNLHLDDIAGLSRTYPWVSAAMAVGILSLAGMPPTGGFLGKFFVFSHVLQGGHVGLVIVAALGSAVSLYYYLRVLVRMYMMEPDPISLLAPQRAWWTVWVVGASVVATLLMGTVGAGRFLQLLHLGLS